uniref:Carbonyl reductase 1 n=1 Tax=Stegastes partitus TaxID=144197 RepID=A0A3B5BGU9_9TELE
MGALYRTVVVKRELSRKAKLSIYQSIYVPTLTYGHEFWVVIEKTRSPDTSGQNVLPLQGGWAQSQREGEELGHPEGARSRAAAPSRRKESIEVVWTSDSDASREAFSGETLFFLCSVADTTPFATQAEVTLKTNFFGTRDMLTHFLPLIKAGGRVVNVSSFVGSRTLNNCSPDLQQRFRSEDITEDELAGLMQRFVDTAQKGKHKDDGWPETAYGVSKTGLTTLSMIRARRLSKERPNDGILLNACCPGWVRTDMAGDKAPKSPDEGAVTPVYLALLSAGATEPHGKFVSDKQVQPW